MKIAVVGTGYVGLVSGVCLAAKGHHVICVDINERIVDNLNRGLPHIYEEGLEPLLKKMVDTGFFSATTDLKAALESSTGAIVAVGTPSEDGVIDLIFVKQVSRQIGAYLKKHDGFFPVIIKSTVVPGTTDTIVRQEIENASGKKLGQFGLGMNPEFLREGVAVEDFMNPDRIVFGSEDPQTLDFLKALYAPWDCDKLCVNTRTAELIKYSNNALLALQISAVNEIANLAANLGGIDIMDVMKGVHLDKRWNPIVNGARVEPEILTYLIPGCGFGGSCFPKDVQALRSQGEQVGMPMQMLNAILDVNKAQPLQVVSILERELGSLEGRKILVLGLAFKPETDDVRESPALRVVEALLDKKAVVSCHDPIAMDHFKRAFGVRAEAVTFLPSWQTEVEPNEVLIVLTKWAEYQALSACDLRGKIVFDARRFLEPKMLNAAHYLSVGRRI